jgi:hypothetical protein
MRMIPRVCVAVLATSLLAACGNAPEPPAAPHEEILRRGDTTVRATVMQTSTLSDAIAARYGIARGDDVVMLMVGVRQGPGEVSAAATVTASATDLGGRRHAIPLHALQAGGVVDHVGTLQVPLPATLDFDIEIRRPGQAALRMDFNRDFR